MSDLTQLDNLLSNIVPSKSIKPGRKARLSPSEWKLIFKRRKQGVPLSDIYIALRDGYKRETPFYSTLQSFKQAAVREKQRIRHEAKVKRVCKKYKNFIDGDPA